MKIGCMVLVRLPAMLEACCRRMRSDLHTRPTGGVSTETLLILFMN
jgi:hypothetical protein